MTNRKANHGGKRVALFIHCRDESTHQRDLRMAVEIIDLQFKSVRRAEIVSIHPSDVLPARFANAAVKRRNQTPIFLVENFDARVGESVQQAGGSVGAAIVDDEKFEVFKSLRENALHRLTKVRLGVEGRHQDADFGLHTDTR